MIQFVLDTDTLSLLQRRHPVVCERAEKYKAETAITVLTVEEQLSGWYGLLRKSRKASIGRSRLMTRHWTICERSSKE